MEKGSTGNHCRIISTKLNRRIAQVHTQRLQFLQHPFMQASSGRHTTSQDDLHYPILLSCKTGFHCQNIYYGLLETGNQPGNVRCPLLSSLLSHARIAGRRARWLAFILSTNCLLIGGNAFSEVEHLRFQSTETEIIRATQPSTRKLICFACQSYRLLLLHQLFFSLLSNPLNGRTARIVQSKNTRYFIKSLTSSIIACTTKQFVVSMIAHKDKLAVGP